MEVTGDSQPQFEPTAEEGDTAKERHDQQEEDERKVKALKDLIVAKQEDPEPSLLDAVSTSEEIMEHLCSLPSNAVDQVVVFAIQLLECQKSWSMVNAVSFFEAAFVFKAVIKCFDKLNGMQRLIQVLHNIASAYRMTDFSVTDKLFTVRACTAILQYFRARFLLLVDSVSPSVEPDNKPLNTSDEAMNDVFHQIHKGQDVGRAFVKGGWPVIDRFLGARGHMIMLELCQVQPATRGVVYQYDLFHNALDVLHMVSLVPDGRKLIVNATLSDGCAGVGVILDVAELAQYSYPRVTVPALMLLKNLVCPPSTISYGLIGIMENQLREAREALRVNCGIKVLLKLLKPEKLKSASSVSIWDLTCQVLLGLARDSRTAHNLFVLHVEEKLLKVIEDPQTYGHSREENWHRTKELLWVLTRSGRATTSEASDTATFEHSMYRWQLIHRDLLQSGMTQTADILRKEIGLTPLPCDKEGVTEELLELYQNNRNQNS